MVLDHNMARTQLYAIKGKPLLNIRPGFDVRPNTIRHRHCDIRGRRKDYESGGGWDWLVPDCPDSFSDRWFRDIFRVVFTVIKCDLLTTNVLFICQNVCGSWPTQLHQKYSECILTRSTKCKCNCYQRHIITSRSYLSMRKTVCALYVPTSSELLPQKSRWHPHTHLIQKLAEA